MTINGFLLARLEKKRRLNRPGSMVVMSETYVRETTGFPD